MSNPKSMIVIGGSDEINGDYSALKKMVGNGKSASSWSCLKDTQVGDELWFYVTSPHSAIVAVGLAESHAREGTNWAYKCKVGTVRWIDSPIARTELLEMFPDWPWPRFTRGKALLTEEQADALRLRTAQTYVTATAANLRGAGFGTPEQNAKVEKAAIRYATNLFTKRGYEVESVESERIGYDLKARKGRQELHLEVKGVSGELPEFVITTNEVSQAQSDPCFRMIVVRNALTTDRNSVEMTGEEFLARYQLAPIAYTARQKRVK